MLLLAVNFRTYDQKVCVPASGFILRLVVKDQESNSFILKLGVSVSKDIELSGLKFEPWSFICAKADVNEMSDW